MHSSGLVHGSLDPRYIFPFSRDDGIIILDAFKSSNNQISVKYNKYSSPEVILCSRSVQREDDYWSIGMMLLEMCLGGIPLEIDEYSTLNREKIEDLIREKNCLELKEKIIRALINRKIDLLENKSEIQTFSRKYKRNLTRKNVKQRIRRVNFESKVKLSLDCSLNTRMFNIINRNMKYLKNLIEITLGCKKLNHKANIIGDSECKAMFSSVKHLENLKKLYLQSKKKINQQIVNYHPNHQLRWKLP